MNKKKSFAVAAAFVVAGSSVATVVHFIDPALLSNMPFVGSTPEAMVENQTVETSKVENAQETIPRTSKEGGDETHLPTLEQSSNDKVEVIAATDFKMPGTQSSSIIRMTREISALQAAMGQGIEDAPSKLKARMLLAREMLLKSDVSKVTENDVQSLAQYVLSGGDPSVAARFLLNSSLSKKQQSLLNGVISYATANFAKAKAELLPLDGSEYNTILDAQLTMVKVHLEASDDRDKNLDQLAHVANLVPGSLIEEAAMRRMIPLIASKDISKDLQYWVTRYLRRYSNSLYYQDFETSLIEVLAGSTKEQHFRNQGLLASIFGVAGQGRAAALSSQMLIKALQTADTDFCKQIEESLNQYFDVKTDTFADSAALMSICRTAEGGRNSFTELKKINTSSLSEDVKKNLVNAMAMAEEIQKDQPLNGDGTVGPDIPVSETEEFRALYASVAQQLDATLKAIKEADADESVIDQ